MSAPAPAEARLEDSFARARAGDEEAFREVWRALHPPLLRYLVARGEESAEDIASETWLQVIRGLPRFSGDLAGFRAWLYTLARHRAVDAGRARAARPAVPTADPPVAGSHPSAESAVLEQFSTASALALVQTLPLAQIELVMLRVVAGLDVNAVAQILGKEPGAVRTGVHRALKTLKTRMEVQADG